MQADPIAGRYIRNGVPFAVPLDETVEAGGAKTPPAKTGNRLIDVTLADDELTEDEIGLLADAANNDDQEAADLLDNLGIDWQTVGKVAGAAGGVALTGAMLASANAAGKMDTLYDAPLLTGRLPNAPRPNLPESEAVDRVNIKSSIDQALTPAEVPETSLAVDENLKQPVDLPSPATITSTAQHQLHPSAVSSMLRLRLKQAGTDPVRVNDAVSRAVKAGLPIDAGPTNDAIQRKQEFDRLNARYQELVAKSGGKPTPEIKRITQMLKALAMRGRSAR